MDLEESPRWRKARPKECAGTSLQNQRQTQTGPMDYLETIDPFTLVWENLFKWAFRSLEPTASVVSASFGENQHNLQPIK